MRKLILLSTVGAVGLLGGGCGGAVDPGPDPVTLAADYVAVENSVVHPFPESATLPDGTGLLITPHFAVQLDRIEITEEVPEHAGWGPEDTAGKPKVPEAGHELIIADVATDINIVPWRSETGDLLTDGVSASLGIGDRAVDLERLPELGDLLVVSAPKDAEVWLRITDADRTQSLNLREGTRGDDAHEGFYRSGDPQLSDEDYAETGTVTAVGLARPVELGMTISQANLLPWTPKQGWAEDGRWWLHLSRISVTSDADDWLSTNTFPVELDLDLGETFTLELSDGTRLTPTDPGTYMINGYAEVLENTSVTFDVPADFASGTLSIVPDGDLAARFQDGTEPASWTQRPAPAEIEITLGS